MNRLQRDPHTVFGAQLHPADIVALAVAALAVYTVSAPGRRMRPAAANGEGL